MFALAGLALPAVTSLFAAVIPILFASLGSLLGFALSRAAQLPRYIKVMALLYQDSSVESETHKYVTSALLILGSILTFIAHSFIPFTGAPILGAVTTPIALLIALVMILATLDLVTQLNEPYLANLKYVCEDDLQNMQDDLLTLHNKLGSKKWAELTQKTQAVFNDLAPKLAETGKDLSEEINKYFSQQLTELVVYFDGENASKITLNESEIKAISESLEPWQKVGGSFVLGAGTGAGTGMMAAAGAAANLAPAAWWSPFVPGAVQSALVGGKIVVTAAVYGTCAVVAPIALGLTIGAGVFGAAMVTLGKIEEHKLSQFLTDVIIASLPMLRADGKFTEEEKQAVLQLLNNPKINPQDKAKVEIAMESDDSFDEIIKKNLLTEAKPEKSEIKHRLLLTITWEIAKADGKIDEKEIALHDRMARILQVPQATVNEIRRLITPIAVTKPSNQPVPVRVGASL